MLAAAAGCGQGFAASVECASRTAAATACCCASGMRGEGQTLICSSSLDLKLWACHLKSGCMVINDIW